MQSGSERLSDEAQSGYFANAAAEVGLAFTCRPYSLQQNSLEVWKMNLCAAHPQGRFLFVAASTQVLCFKLHLGRIENGEAVADSIEVSDAIINFIRCSQCQAKNMLITAGDDAFVTIFDADNFKQPLCRLSNLIEGVLDCSTYSAAVYHQQLKVVASSNSFRLSFFEISNLDMANESRVVAHGHAHNVPCVSVSFDDRYIASASIDCSVRVWSADTNYTLATLRLGGTWGWAVCWIQGSDIKQLGPDESITEVPISDWPFRRQQLLFSVGILGRLGQRPDILVDREILGRPAIFIRRSDVNSSSFSYEESASSVGQEEIDAFVDDVMEHTPAASGSASAPAATSTPPSSSSATASSSAAAPASASSAASTAADHGNGLSHSPDPETSSEQRERSDATRTTLYEPIYDRSHPLIVVPIDSGSEQEDLSLYEDAPVRADIVGSVVNSGNHADLPASPGDDATRYAVDLSEASSALSRAASAAESLGVDAAETTSSSGSGTAEADVDSRLTDHTLNLMRIRATNRSREPSTAGFESHLLIYCSQFDVYLLSRTLRVLDWKSSVAPPSVHHFEVRNRLLFLEYIPELALVIVGSSSCSQVSLLLVFRDSQGCYKLSRQGYVPETEIIQQPLKGFSVYKDSTVGSLDELTVWNLYLLYDDGSICCFQLRRPFGSRELESGPILL